MSDSSPLDISSGSHSSYFPGYGSTAAQDSKVDLPDMIERLKYMGIYGEYLVYKSSYQKWRKGEHKGAHGELKDLESRAYPEAKMHRPITTTAFIFSWRFTIAYWSSVCFIVGSFIFTLSSVICCLHNGQGYVFVSTNLNVSDNSFTAVPVFVGSLFFTAGCYFTYLQLINIGNTEVQSLFFLWPDWSKVSAISSKLSVVGTFAYFIGALLYNVCTLSDVFPKVSIDYGYYLVNLPSVFGSTGFLIGGVCEFVHARSFLGKSDDHRVWWSSFLSLIGCVSFFAASLPSVLAPSWSGATEIIYVNTGYAVGSVMFALASVLMLKMWRANDFGLAMIPQLNRLGDGEASPVNNLVRRKAQEEGEEDQATEDGRLSIRSCFFIIAYCWFMCVATFDCMIEDVETQRKGMLLRTTGTGIHVFVVLVVFVVLLLHSAVTSIPDHEPFKSASYLCRFILLLGATCYTVDVFAFVKEVLIEKAIEIPKI